MSDPAVAGPSQWETLAPATEPSTPWTQVIGRKGRKRKGKIAPTQLPPNSALAKAKASAPKPKPIKIVAPRTAAIMLTLKEGTSTFAEVLARAKAAITLADFGLMAVKVRATMTGARVMEVGGESPDQTADLLAERLRQVVGEEADVTRPNKLADLRVSGLGEMASEEELVTAMARVGGCSTGLIKVGATRSSAWGQRSALVRCPAVAAKALAAAGKISVGWAMVAISPVAAQPMRCYKCMALGHTRALCPSKAEHGSKCFRCGGEGHLAVTCEAVTRCAVCAEAGRPHGHRMGGSKCSPPTIRGRAPVTRATQRRTQVANEELKSR